MSSEYATVGGRGRDYPTAWGYPPGDRQSEERAAWVRANVVRHLQSQELRGRLTWTRARAELWRKRYAPGEGPDPR